MEEILTKFNFGEEKLLPSQIHSQVKGEISMDVIPASVDPLEQEFDDDAGEELDLRRDKDERKRISLRHGLSR